MRLAMGFWMVVVLPSSVQALQDPQFVEARFHRVHLKNGNFIDGDLLRETETEVGLKLRIGEMSIRREQVQRIEIVKIRSLKEPAAVEPPKPVPVKEPATFVPRTTPAAPVRPAPEPGEDKSVPPLPTPSGVSEEIRQRVDRAILSWNAAPPNDKPNISNELRKIAADAIPYLCLLIEKRAQRVPVHVLCSVLQALNDVRAVPGFRAALKAEPTVAREVAVQALLDLGKPECIPALVDALQDPADTVWKPASDFLARQYNEDKLPDLLPALESALPKAESRQGILLTLGSMDGNRPRQILLDLLRDGGDSERLEALQGLSLRPRPEEAEMVHPMLGRASRALRQEACLFLGKARYERAIPDLIRILETEDIGLGANAHWALRQITGERLDANGESWRNWYERSPLKGRIEGQP